MLSRIDAAMPDGSGAGIVQKIRDLGHTLATPPLTYHEMAQEGYFSKSPFPVGDGVSFCDAFPLHFHPERKVFFNFLALHKFVSSSRLPAQEGL